MIRCSRPRKAKVTIDSFLIYVEWTMIAAALVVVITSPLWLL